VEARTQTAPEQVFTLSSDAASVPRARELARDVASPLMDEAQRANLDLALTEVVSNAIRHSGTDDEVVVKLTSKDDYLCVRVTDGGQGLLPTPGAMTTEPGAGYGLFLVEQLTRRWGMTREDGRTRVWFEVDFEAPDVAA
jgi:anti-sigma regulatory factor (Ser/Thr protein kinase)